MVYIHQQRQCLQNCTIAIEYCSHNRQEHNSVKFATKIQHCTTKQKNYPMLRVNHPPRALVLCVEIMSSGGPTSSRLHVVSSSTKKKKEKAKQDLLLETVLMRFHAVLSRLYVGALRRQAHKRWRNYLAFICKTAGRPHSALSKILRSE